MDNRIIEYEQRLDSLKRQMDELKQFRDELKKDTPLVKSMIDCIERMGIERDLLFGHSRKRGRLFFARCVFATQLRKYGYTYEDIAKILQRNHATVVYYIKSYDKAVKETRFEREFVGFIKEFNDISKQNNMKREIKFRGKRLDNGELVYGDRLSMTARICTSNSDESCRVQYEVDSDTLEQYTGLKDSNGMEIYEGDILGADDKVIGWIEGGLRGYCYDVVYIKKDVNESPAPGDARWPLYSIVKYDYPNRIEVIGNIHDNPELLNPEK